VETGEDRYTIRMPQYRSSCHRMQTRVQKALDDVASSVCQAVHEEGVGGGVAR